MIQVKGEAEATPKQTSPAQIRLTQQPTTGAEAVGLANLSPPRSNPYFNLSADGILKRIMLVRSQTLSERHGERKELSENHLLRQCQSWRIVCNAAPADDTPPKPKIMRTRSSNYIVPVHDEDA